MIANSHLVAQPAAGRPNSSTAKLDGGKGSSDEQSGFKEVLEQGLQSSKGETPEPAVTKQKTSVKRLASFETRAEFTDHSQDSNLEVTSDTPSQELVDAVGDAELDINVVAGKASVADSNKTENISNDKVHGISEDTVRSIVNTLMTKPSSEVSATANGVQSSETQMMPDKNSANMTSAVQSAATAGHHVDSVQLAAASQANGLASNFVFSQKQSGNDVRRIGFDVEAKTSVRDVATAFSQDGRGKNDGRYTGGFSEIKNMTRMGESGVGSRDKTTSQTSVNRAASAEPTALAGMQTTGQVASAANDAPPPVKDQVLDRLGPEIRSMHKAETTSAAQAQASGVAAANRNVISLQLYPIGLGRVQAHLTKDGDGVKIDLIVESRQTLDLLNADIDALKTSMRALGASESNINITLGRNNNNAGQDAAAENGDLSNSENAMAEDSDADGRNKRDQDGDIDSRLAALQSISDSERVGYDSSRIII